MKTFVCITILVICYAASLAQAPPDHSVQCREKMSLLSWMSGRWSGEANVTTGPGQTIKVHQEEFVEFRLDSTLLVVEGVGTSAEDSSRKLFNAFAAINFNPYTQKYSLRSYTKEGNSTDAYFTVLDSDKYEWGFDIPGGGKIRYTITTENGKKTWKETGEFSRDGQSWYPFISMQLQKN